MTLKCTTCQKQIKHPPYNIGVMDRETMDANHPVCPVCGGLHFKWLHEHPIEFDYYYQVYRNADGSVAEIDYECFPCPTCKSPARLMGVNPYFENYLCGTCNRSIDVK